MEKQEQANAFKINVRTILTFLVLFVLPLGSLYFLNSGVQYRKDALSELEDRGQEGKFSLYNQNNLLVTPELLRGRVAVVNFFSRDAGRRSQADRIAKVHQSFNDTEDVFFLSFLEADSSVNLIDKAKDLGIADHEQWFLLRTPSEQWRDLPDKAFLIPDPNTGVALVDTSLTIRRLYDIDSNQDMGRLVEHISMVIPKQKRR